MERPQVTLIALRDIPEVRPGDDLVQIILDGLDRESLALEDGDVVVVTQKIVSKAEGCLVDLSTVTPTPRALELAEAVGKDPHLVEVILRESRDVLRQREGVLIMETRHGWVCANAGVDRSNVAGVGATVALTLPVDPDASARRIRNGLIHATRSVATTRSVAATRSVAGRHIDIAVIITDSHGRAWRLATVNLAIGVAGMHPIADLRGQPDRFGYTLRVTTVARADELAAAAGLLSGQAAEGLPIIIIRGAGWPRGDGAAVEMQRPAERDLFR
ncbi:MAG: coenzyme F420-0:L-glutamate ligase [Anaerolineae bacterium]|nr:coenzyme F420-0:L-glutamate ligase [Anaerolineae bacterium]